MRQTDRYKDPSKASFFIFLSPSFFSHLFRIDYPAEILITKEQQSRAALCFSLPFLDLPSRLPSSDTPMRKFNACSAWPAFAAHP